MKLLSVFRCVHISNGVGYYFNSSSVSCNESKLNTLRSGFLLDNICIKFFAWISVRLNFHFAISMFNFVWETCQIHSQLCTLCILSCILRVLAIYIVDF